ncbi:MAG: hypothetical protein H6945_14970 [Zoogloeaceae bacterium]|nr:hypothetical protein [Rhodocyclaceae bacterium]MCP5237036.1 hypothetical protein [Zoogloeaceae bacterium]
MNARVEIAELPHTALADEQDVEFAGAPMDEAAHGRVGPLLPAMALVDLPREECSEPAVEPKKKADKAKKKDKAKLAVAADSEAAGSKTGKIKPGSEFGSARGVETLFRSSYRTQLDLTALAATKANIMISLNGFILSVLTLSGPFVLVAEPMFTVPIAIFLATCLASIIFAVLAARPRLFQTRRSPEDFASDRANLLVFEEFSSLTEEQHTAAMLDLLRDNGRIYRNMSRQIYFLGTMANRKFRMLSLSYAIFLSGLTLSTLLLLAIGFFHNTADFATLLGQVQTGRVGG